MIIPLVYEMRFMFIKTVWILLEHETCSTCLTSSSNPMLSNSRYFFQTLAVNFIYNSIDPVDGLLMNLIWNLIKTTLALPWAGFLIRSAQMLCSTSWFQICLVRLCAKFEQFCLTQIRSINLPGNVAPFVVDPDPHWFWFTGSGSRLELRIRIWIKEGKNNPKNPKC